MVLFGISPAFAGLSQTQGQITHVLLTRAPLYNTVLLRYFSFDLHVLSTPPAFVLSQDQTLQKNLILCNVTQGNLTDCVTQNPPFPMTEAIWKLCTYLVFKDHVPAHFAEYEY